MLVEEYVSAKKKLPRDFHSDPRVMRAYAFWNAFQNLKSSSTPTGDMVLLEKKFTDMFTAYSIYKGTTLERYFIEALVMARVPANIIASDMGYSTRVVSTYEHLFFDVRDRLDNGLYVLSNILNPIFSSTSSAGDYDHLWKIIGYFCGAAVLKAMWQVGDIDEEVKRKLNGILRSKLLTQATSASFARKPNQFNAGEIIGSYVDVENSSKASDDSSNDNEDDNYLEKLQGDVLEYMQLTLKPLGLEQGSVEKCSSSGGAHLVKEEDYDRPFKPTDKSEDS